MVPAQDILANYISSSFVSRWLVSQNVKNIKKEEVPDLEKLNNLVKNTNGEDKYPDITMKEIKIVIQEPMPNMHILPRLVSFILK